MTTKEPTQLELPVLPRPRVRLDTAHEDTDSGRAPWQYVSHPVMDGWYEVTRIRDLQEKVAPDIERWWFNGANGPLVWQPQGPSSRNNMTMHDEFMERSLAWRGLVQPEAGIYPCPPYSSVVLLTRAQQEEVNLSTMYAAYTRPQRKRNRI